MPVPLFRGGFQLWQWLAGRTLPQVAGLAPGGPTPLALATGGALLAAGGAASVAAVVAAARALRR